MDGVALLVVWAVFVCPVVVLCVCAVALTPMIAIIAIAKLKNFLFMILNV